MPSEFQMATRFVKQVGEEEYVQIELERGKSYEVQRIIIGAHPEFDNILLSTQVVEEVEIEE